MLASKWTLNTPCTSLSRSHPRFPLASKLGGDPAKYNSINFISVRTDSHEKNHRRHSLLFVEYEQSVVLPPVPLVAPSRLSRLTAVCTQAARFAS